MCRTTAGRGDGDRVGDPRRVSVFRASTAGLDRMASCLAAETGPADAVAGELEAAELPPDAFGAVTHSPLVDRMCARFRSDAAGRMRSASGEIDHLAGGVADARSSYCAATAAAATDIRNVPDPSGPSGRAAGAGSGR
jgi:hypothetical protein